MPVFSLACHIEALPVGVVLPGRQEAKSINLMRVAYHAGSNKHRRGQQTKQSSPLLPTIGPFQSRKAAL
jgi:hypothetical protein